MTPADTGKVLMKCAAFDQRTIGEGDILAWHEVLANLGLQDALTAVTAHYREQTQRAMPADIRKLAIGIRDQRKAGTAAALPAGPRRDRSPEVTALVHQVLDSLPKPDLHERARERAQRERGRPPVELRRKRGGGKGKPPKDYPPPATGEVAALASRYLLDGYDPADVAERFAVSRRWCQRTIRRFSNGHEAATA